MPRQDFFAWLETIYPVAQGPKPEQRKICLAETGTKAAFVKCTFY
jgi:hypothetical protein